MDKIIKIIKNVLLFLVIFLLINYIFQSFQDDTPDATVGLNTLIIQTTNSEYGINETVSVEIINHSDQAATLNNDCPGEPFNVYRFYNNEWQPKSFTPELNCSNVQAIVLAPGQKTTILYDKWNHALFHELGRFRIEASAKIGETDQIFTSNEFLITEPGIFSQLWNGVFYKPIYNALIYLTKVLPEHDLGWAIIILTIIIRSILLIPSQKALVSQRRMQELQPKLEEIKTKYKGDQQKIASETMKLWKDAKVNPLGSCLPLLLQLPFLIAFFYVVQDGLNPDNTYLLYVQYADFNLTDINTNFLGLLELTAYNFYVIPLILGLLQFIQIKLSMARISQKGQSSEVAMANNMMSYMMPVMIAVFAASLPAGVSIYWGTSTVYGIIQQLFVNKIASKAKSSSEPSVKVIHN